MTSNLVYPAKVMLFGEYSILMGSSALSMPFPRFEATLRIPEKEVPAEEGDLKESNNQLAAFCQFMIEEQDYFGSYLDLDRFAKETSGGLYLRSTIPQHYGLGSSGALCAAVLGRYEIRDTGSGIRELFSRMESFFHGKSSGYDPLVCYIQKTLLLNPGQPVREVQIPSRMTERFPMSLIDSGMQSGTGSLVPGFLEHQAPEGILSQVAGKYVVLTNQCIASFLREDQLAFREALVALSEFQYREFKRMIPSSVHSHWEAGLKTGHSVMKLCGSGGGGFFLCFNLCQT
ncbi:MAG: hypothetical protein IH596_04960 [Bacteroidales bacterium]|nr:hypothetical protein [Bacteroidales bacterium]